LGLEGAQFALIEHEDAIVAEVYEVRAVDGMELILKICAQPHHYHREVYFLRALAGRLPVPHIMGLVEPAEGVQGAILMEWLPGRLATPDDLTEPLAREVGALLAHLHQMRVAGYGDLIDPGSLTDDPARHFSEKFREGLAECRGHLPAELWERCQAAFEAQLHLLSVADGPCIIHRDFRPGNLILSGGKIQGLIDWASARGSFAQEDLASFESGDWSGRPEVKRALLAGYAQVRPVPPIAPLMPLLQLSRAIATIGFTVKRGSWNGSDALLYQKHRRILEGLLL
jgi:aminoglycoside phosphotransferase (APT) family kinase protein